MRTRWLKVLETIKTILLIVRDLLRIFISHPDAYPPPDEPRKSAPPDKENQSDDVNSSRPDGR